MEGRRPIALLVGEGQGIWSSVQDHLEDRGWLCRFSESLAYCSDLANVEGLDLLLSTSPIHLTHPVLDSLRGSNCSVFYSVHVERGCWWIPLLDHGRDCLGAPALHPHELLGAIDSLMRKPATAS